MPAVLGNAVLYKNGVPVAAVEGGDLVLRRPPDPGERIDRALRVYRAPAAPAEPDTDITA